MTIRFVPQGKNYQPENIVEIIANINDPVIQDAFHSKNKEIQVKGDIHASQLTSDNPEKFYWLRLSVHDETGQPIIGYSGIHIFVCFRNMQMKNGRFYPLNCITPQPIRGTDMPDVSGKFGFWEFRKITYGVQQQIKQNPKPIMNTVPKRLKTKRISIIDPKTGKKIDLN